MPADSPSPLSPGETGSFLKPPRGGTWADIPALLLLMVVVLTGPVALGATRLLLFGPLMVLVFFAAFLLVLAGMRKNPDPPVLPPGWILYVGFLVYSLVALFFTTVTYDARVEVLKIASYLAAYWMWTQLASRRSFGSVLIPLLLLLGVGLSLYALNQHLHGSNLVLGFERPKQYGMRASGTYTCPNHFANLFELIIPFALAYVFTPSMKTRARVLAGASLLVFLPVVLLTQSRSGWLGVIAGAAVTVCMVAAKRSRKALLLVVLGGVLIGGAATPVLWFKVPMVQERVKETMLHSADHAVTGRLMLWRDTLPLIREKPVFGHGPGSYRFKISQVNQNPRQVFWRYAHNEILHTLAELGIVGLLFFVVGIPWAGWKFFSYYRQTTHPAQIMLISALSGAVLASLVHAQFDFNFHLFSNNHVLICLAGMTAGVLSRGGFGVSAKKTTGITRGFMGVSAVFLVVVMLLSYKALSSSVYAFRADLLSRNLQYKQALVLYKKSIAIDGTNWRSFLQAAESLRTIGFWARKDEIREACLDEAASYYEKAMALSPEEPGIYLGYSKVLFYRGEDKEALDQLRTAIRLSPYDITFRVELGLKLKTLKRYREALAVFKRVYEIEPWNPLARRNIQKLKKLIQSTTE